MSVDLSTNIGTVALKNPVLAASGTFGYGLEFEGLCDLNRLGGVVTKGLSLSPRAGNPPPRIHETACGMLNAIGLHNIGVEAFIETKLPHLKKLNTAIIANIYGETPEAFVKVAQRLASVEGLVALEVNVSCPNVQQGGLDLGTNPEAVRDLLGSIRQVVKGPLWAKLTPNVTDVVALAQAAVEGGADAITLINSVKGMAVDWKTRRPQLSTAVGGLTGPAIKPIALAKVFEVSRRCDVPIIGVGGISSAEDVLEFLLVGASAVQVGTLNFSRGNALEILLQDLTTLLEGQGVTKLCSMVGGLAWP